MTALGRPPVLLDIVEEHFDELDFLWEHREANVFTPDWTLEDLAEHEERAEAHLDGLRLSELHGVDLAEERVAGDQTFAATAATFVLVETGEPDLLELVAGALRTAPAEACDGIRIALRHLPAEALADTLTALLGSEEPFRAACAWDVLAFHRRSVEGIERLLTTDDEAAGVLSLGAAGRLATLTTDDVRRATAHPEPAIRRAGFEAAARMGMPNLARHCRAAAIRDIDADPVAIELLGMLGDASDVTTLRSLIEAGEHAEAAVAALGALGRVEAVPVLLDLMADDDLGVAATEAYRRITAADDIEGERPFPPPEVPEGEDEDEALPPDPEKARADWSRRASQMSADVRWQSGDAIPEDQIPAGFDRLTLEARRDVFLRLRSRVAARAPDLELEALARRQGPPI